ncbi:MAG: phosphoglucosamine mutase [Erysipelotrichia bacterium]|nr:phosphoglucosamine mutase [Erysipelotrichia bacterium]NCC53933.1 phosphoglucosamine mutase [Erysipelotrichia bacterium]
MGKYFGTDGARGKANVNLTLAMAVKIGQYIGHYYSKDRHARIVVGKDTRLSSDMFEAAIVAGATSTGANVYVVGTCPTPCVSYLIRKDRFDCGVMISASHNPFYDNGIKLFNGEGKKMDPEVEMMIEKYIDDEISVEVAIDEKIGQKIDYSESLSLYESWLKNIVNCDLTGMNIALDLANGSATSCALDTLRDLGAKCKVIHTTPDGININTHCGSTHPEDLQKLMKTGKYDVGFAFDGDADRLIAVDEEGNLFDGDHTLYVCGKYFTKHGKLNKNTIVTTVMANLGFYKAMEAHAINTEQTAVGDKYVFECMENNDYSIGGEQSGHIIFKEHANTGDGLLTALKLLEVMTHEKKSLKQLSEGLTIYPQLLVNIRVKDKNEAMADEAVLAEVEKVKACLGEDGRILVRTSGTEPLVRVMVEATSDELCKRYVYQVIDVIKARGLEE